MGTDAQFQFFFDDPRLRMSFAGRLLVRVVSYVFYLFLIVAIVTLFSSELRGLEALGVFLLLLLLDQIMHWREADKHMNELVPGPVNLAHYLTPRAFSVIEHAFGRSLFVRSDFFLEVLRELLGFAEVKEAIRRLDIDPKEFKRKVDELAEEKVETNKERALASAERIATLAFERAANNRHRFIEVGDLLSGVADVEEGGVKRICAAFSIDSNDLDRALILSTARRSAFSRFPATVGGFLFETYRPVRHRVMNRAWTARTTPELDRIGADFTDLARDRAIGFLIGHADEYERMVQVLARPENPNVLLVGESGVGKESIVAHLALALTKDNVPRELFDRRLVSLNIGALVAGASPDELQRRFQNIVREINTAGNIILYIPDMHQLAKTSGAGALSAADALVPIIMDNRFPVIGATYPREFKEFLESRTDFAGAFEVIRVEEIAETEAEKVLAYEAVLMERSSGVVVSFGAVKEAVKIAKRYMRNRLLPACAVALLKDAVFDAKKRGESFLGRDDVIRVAETKINVPLHGAGNEETAKLLDMERIIHERYVGQEEAVKAVADALREYRSGLSRKNGPIASFLFLGPTGVGKTELCKIIAKIQFGSEKAMVRFDMSEYQDKSAIAHFIGSADGTISGVLTDAVREKPYGLILLDEFEKSHPDVFNLFLSVFDDGRLADGVGRVVDFQNTIIVATSNAHADIMYEALREGRSMASIAEYVKQKLVDVFRPELLNRFSRLVVFRNLEPAELVKIAELQVLELKNTLLEQGIALSYEEAALRKIASLGYNPAFGARPLREVIETKLRAPLSQMILKKEVKRGGGVSVVLKGGDVALVSS